MKSMRMLLVVTILMVAKETSAYGAGRAFPIAAENYAIKRFRDINSRIEWDPTNFLVDKSGWYANCKNVRRGYEKVPEVTRERNTMGVIYDYINGNGVDVDSVDIYIKTIIDKWMRSREHNERIREADRFGCSVRPGCDGVAVVACLFSPSGTIVTDGGPYYRPPGDEPRPIEGQAFTVEQYDLAEKITGNKWDRSHFLENLSGFEVSCSMLGSGSWSFAKAITTAMDHGMTVIGLNGEAPNKGSTQQAMEAILKSFKAIRTATNVGCSVIPDCMTGRGDLGDEMWVVVTCIYEEY